MQAPALYANVEVSQGVGNTNFQVLLLCLLGIEMITANRIVSGKAGITVGSSENEADRKHVGNHYDVMFMAGLFMACVGVLVCHRDIRKSTDYVCYEYIVTGQAADYRAQMDLQTSLLLSDEKDVVLPGINDWQGPLMHMPVTDDVTKWTNTVTAQFYEKNSVVAIPRTEWIEIYGQGE